LVLHFHSLAEGKGPSRRQYRKCSPLVQGKPVAGACPFD
jgi:hypothetical protein